MKSSNALRAVTVGDWQVFSPNVGPTTSTPSSKGIRDWRWLLPFTVCAALLLAPPGALAQPSVTLTETALSIIAPGPAVLWDLEADMPVAAADSGILYLPRPPDGVYLILVFEAPKAIRVYPFVVGMPPQRYLWTLL
jgi:hypothetical protein